MSLQSYSSGNDDRELRRVVDDLSERLAQIEATVRPVHPSANSSGEISDTRLSEIAVRIYRSRRRREQYFAVDLFGEPAWDMLLDLFVCKIRGLQVSTKSASAASGVPGTTALRWINHLEKHGLLRRTVKPDDARLTLIELTTDGYRLMRKYVIEGMAKTEVPLPH